MESILPRLRESIHTMARNLGLSILSLYGRIKHVSISTYLSAIKPCLAKSSQIARLEFTITMLHLLKPDIFIDKTAWVHIAEKWPCITKTTNKYYAAPNEKPLFRTCEKKRFII